MVRTHLTVTPAMIGSSHQPAEVLSIVHPILQTHGFGEFPAKDKPPASPITFSDWYPGKNPNIWVSISQESWPVSVDFMERWTAHRSRKHKSMAREVESALEQHDLRVTKQQ
jgi:hypothetical protein